VRGHGRPECPRLASIARRRSVARERSLAVLRPDPGSRPARDPWRDRRYGLEHDVRGVRARARLGDRIADQASLPPSHPRAWRRHATGSAAGPRPGDDRADVGERPAPSLAPGAARRRAARRSARPRPGRPRPPRAERLWRSGRSPGSGPATRSRAASCRRRRTPQHRQTGVRAELKHLFEQGGQGRLVAPAKAGDRAVTASRRSPGTPHHRRTPARSPATNAARRRTHRAAAPPSSPNRGPPCRARRRDRPHRTPPAPSPPRRRSQTKQDAPPAATHAGSATTTTPATITGKKAWPMARIVPGRTTPALCATATAGSSSAGAPAIAVVEGVPRRARSSPAIGYRAASASSSTWPGSAEQENSSSSSQPASVNA
jgi:hypothetical protein